MKIIELFSSFDDVYFELYIYIDYIDYNLMNQPKNKT